MNPERRRILLQAPQEMVEKTELAEGEQSCGAEDSNSYRDIQIFSSILSPLLKLSLNHMDRDLIFKGRQSKYEGMIQEETRKLTH